MIIYNSINSWRLKCSEPSSQRNIDQRFGLSVHGILESHANPIRNVGAVYDKQTIRVRVIIDSAENQQHVQCGLFMGLCCAALGAQPDHQVAAQRDTHKAEYSHLAKHARHMANSSNRASRRGRSSCAVRQHLRPALLYVAAPLLGLVYNDRFLQPCYK